MGAALKTRKNPELAGSRAEWNQEDPIVKGFLKDNLHPEPVFKGACASRQILSAKIKSPQKAKWAFSGKAKGVASFVSGYPSFCPGIRRRLQAL